MQNRNLLASLVFLLAAGGFWAGCTVGFSPEDGDPQRFYCETNEDCLTQQGFECDTDRNRCFDPGTGQDAECIDEDNDGYGSGENRQACVTKCRDAGLDNCDQRSEKDCDDADPDVHPFAAEVCDGKVNNCNLDAQDEAGAFSCSGNADNCPALADVPTGVTSTANFVNPQCENGQCVYLPLNQNPCKVDSTVVKLTCENSNNYSWVRDSSKGFGDLPSECQNLD